MLGAMKVAEAVVGKGGRGSFGSLLWGPSVNT
jgi:hypothetical protein